MKPLRSTSPLTWNAPALILASLFTLGAVCDVAAPLFLPTVAWQRHVISDSLSGADGVRLGDADADGRTDLVVAWEDSGAVTVHLNPGPITVEAPWPTVRIGQVGSVEDAVFVDLDNDGALDVVSCCEGGVRSMFVHWAPRDRRRILDPSAWQTEPLPAAQGAQKWMFCAPAQIDGSSGVDLFAGAKGDNAKIGWFKSPTDPRQLAAWTWHEIAEAAWVMSLIPQDIDGDGDADLIASDRKGSQRGSYWLENPGSAFAEFLPWTRHPIGDAPSDGVMFVDWSDLDGDGLTDLVVATAASRLLFHRRIAPDTYTWQTDTIALPPDTGTGKGVRVADIDLDGTSDIVFSCEGAGGKTGVAWLSARLPGINALWTMHDISGPRGVKFDLVQVLDLDQDGDPDVITTEESQNLGLIWYENPRR